MAAVQWIYEHIWLLWLVPVPPALWYVPKTRTARTVARIVRVCAWNWLLKREGVSAARRRELVDGAAQRDLESPD